MTGQRDFHRHIFVTRLFRPSVEASAYFEYIFVHLHKFVKVDFFLKFSLSLLYSFWSHSLLGMYTISFIMRSWQSLHIILPFCATYISSKTWQWLGPQGRHHIDKLDQTFLKFRHFSMKMDCFSSGEFRSINLFDSLCYPEADFLWSWLRLVSNCHVLIVLPSHCDLAFYPRWHSWEFLRLR